MASIHNGKEEDGHRSGSTAPSAEKSEKPDNTAFKQQRLPAWQPVLTAGSVVPAFFIIGLLFIPIGIGLFITSNTMKEFEIDYTGVERDSPCFSCTQLFSLNSTCVCSVPFTLQESFEGNVFMYYGLSNFYQNHRRYVKSRDDRQLNGDTSALTNPSQNCAPYNYNNKLPIAPCGAIANSLFNDTLKLFYIQENGNITRIPLIKKGIAWWTDKYVKFRNPSGYNFTTAFQGTTGPISWPRPVTELDPTDPDNNGFINEDFIVWMRTAALPTFRKLYRMIPKNNQAPTLPRGNYTLEITYNYPVINFDGRKRMILSTISWMGGKNPFLGIAYMTVGSIAFVLGLVLLVIHYKYGNRNNNAEIPN
ncbi:transmembrane protein 30Aa [Clarias gariepinus]|uniref:transmembrane protein 30Aa n=1 Tax=Clarias gariepinus TaxID=13013 RepID=UPI00234C38AA|nr:transmembrane protein 30Aa [Clarias gariepinus]